MVNFDHLFFIDDNYLFLSVLSFCFVRKNIVREISNIFIDRYYTSEIRDDCWGKKPRYGKKTL